MTIHPLDDVRGLLEEGKTSAEWLALARIQVERTLLATGYFTADDLAELGIPEQYRRSIHGSVTGFYSGPGYMVEIGRRKSERPERKGAKNTVFQLTALGRQELSKLVGVGAGSSSTAGGSLGSFHEPSEAADEAGRSPAPSPDPGENQRGRDRQVRGAGCDEDGSAPVVKADRPSDNSRRNTQPARLSDSPETLSLFEAA